MPMCGEKSAQPYAQTGGSEQGVVNGEIVSNNDVPINAKEVELANAEEVEQKPKSMIRRAFNTTRRVNNGARKVLGNARNMARNVLSKKTRSKIYNRAKTARNRLVTARNRLATGAKGALKTVGHAVESGVATTLSSLSSGGKKSRTIKRRLKNKKSKKSKRRTKLRK